MGRFQERLPKEKKPQGSGKKRKFQPLFRDFAVEKMNQLELLRVMNSKKPQLDVTRATNKQMREEDQEVAAKRKQMSQKDKRKEGRQGPGGKRKGSLPSKGGKEREAQEARCIPGHLAWESRGREYSSKEGRRGSTAFTRDLLCKARTIC
jgi:regulator of ribosome biosynthesis